MTNLRNLRVALVHDWLTGMRGGEKVLEAFADLFPNAPIYTLLYREGSVSETLASRVIHTSRLQRLPFAISKYRYYLPLLPRFIEQLQLAPVDLVLSTSSCVAKGIVPPAGSIHASYVHSPMRYIYDRHDDYFSVGRSTIAARLAMRIFRRYLQDWDIRTTDRVDRLVANSSFVSWRIWSLYGRDATVINPPVNADEFHRARRTPEDYYLMVSALVPYKNVDVAMEAFRLLDRRLVVAGSGPLLDSLRENCPKNVELRGWVDAGELPSLVAGWGFSPLNVKTLASAPGRSDGRRPAVIAARRRWRTRQCSGSRSVSSRRTGGNGGRPGSSIGKTRRAPWRTRYSASNGKNPSFPPTTCKPGHAVSTASTFNSGSRSTWTPSSPVPPFAEPPRLLQPFCVISSASRSFNT
ncbi:MAG: hypothetical protein U1D30_12370 [Planctomycetota bacterium]